MTNQHRRDTSQRADWARLERVLRQALAGGAGDGAAAPAGLPGVVDVDQLLQEAYLLTLQGRADMPSLIALAARGAYRSWAVLTRTERGTTAQVAAVLDGWEAAGLPIAGHRGTTTPSPGQAWTGRAPAGPAEVLAVWHAGAASASGLSDAHVLHLAASGDLTPDNAPEPDGA